MRALILAALLLAGCASSPGPLEEARAWAWDEHPYRVVDTWQPVADVTGSCVGKAYAICERLRPLGYECTYLFGNRTDRTYQLHMVPIVRRYETADWQAIDFDRVWNLADLPWKRWDDVTSGEPS